MSWHFPLFVVVVLLPGWVPINSNYRFCLAKLECSIQQRDCARVFENSLTHAFEDDRFVLVPVRQVVFRTFDVGPHLCWHSEDCVVEIQV